MVAWACVWRAVPRALEARGAHARMRARAAAALSRRRWGPLLGGSSAAEEGSGAGVFMSSLRADVCLSSLTLFDRVAVTVVVQSFRSKTKI